METSANAGKVYSRKSPFKNIQLESSSLGYKFRLEMTKFHLFTISKIWQLGAEQCENGINENYFSYSFFPVLFSLVTCRFTHLSHVLRVPTCHAFAHSDVVKQHPSSCEYEVVGGMDFK